MSDEQKRPILVLLTSHWVSMAGVTLVTLAGFSWLFALPLNIRGHVGNPYIGLLLFIALPAVFFAGLALIPLGIVLSTRRIKAGLGDPIERRAAWRRAGVFFAIMTLANIVIGSQLSYRAVEHMETVQFCGQSCHAMKPEFTAHLFPPHQEVGCASCHVAPGATGWLKAKMAGTRQLIGVMFNTFPRPIESAMESNRLVSSADTCEQCDARQKTIGPRLRVISKFKDDEVNTRTETVLVMLVGGGRLGGIHGAHLGPGVRVRYAASDRKRRTIPWVEYRNAETRVTRTFDMQCVDCHNRAAHVFELPDRSVDGALASGEIPMGLPFVKKIAVELLKANYSSDGQATERIPAGISAFYWEKYPAVANRRIADVQAAGQALLTIYRRNVFRDLTVTWGTYPNNLGHAADPGCFRCHDESHVTPDKKTITQDCSTCHQSLAVEETSPEILKTLGVADQLSKIEKQ
jgi:hypothetical protein